MIRFLVSATGQPGQVRVDIHDSGVGLTAAEQAQLFTRFFRAHHEATQDSHGTGLGLAITRSLIEVQGGDIFVSSSPGQGSTFSFTLPAAPQPPTPEPTEARGDHSLA